MVIVIPEGFSVFHPTKQPPVLLALDASNTLNALDQLYYVTETWQPHMPGFRPEWQPQSRMLFNRTMEGRHYFVVSLLVLLITLLGVCFTSISVVNEKEKGILDQLNATPLSRHAYLTGKLIPFMVLGLAELVLGILFCHFVYGLQVEGSFLLLLLVGALFLMCMLGLGLLISTLSDNQVQAMYLIIFTLITLILLSTMFSQLGGMPMWAQHLRHINPIYLMLDCSRLIVLKGFGIRETAVQAGSLMALGLGILGLAVLNTRKTSR